jgi:DNA polymerase-3 subunit alpha
LFLNCQSYFSFRYGTLSPEELVSKAAALGIEALALTDIKNTSGVFPFVQACQKAGIKPLVGIDFRDQQGKQLYVGLARNLQGFRQLNEFLSVYSMTGEKLPLRPPMMDQAFIIYPWQEASTEKLRENEFWGVRPDQCRQLHVHSNSEQRSRMLIFSPVCFSDRSGYQAHRLLRAIDKNIIIARQKKEDLAWSGARLSPLDDLLDPFKPFPELIYQTVKLIDDCNFDFQLQEPRNRKTFTGNRQDDRLLLSKLSEEGLKRRFKVSKMPSSDFMQAKSRIQKELEIIDNMGFSPYFLITWDIIRYAKSRDFRHVGRGSGANSMVAYCMGITNVDPIKLDLYFERFINPHRNSPPDFDLDFAWNERDEVIDYVFKRYGRRHTALLASYSTFKGRSIVRELGKVFGLPKREIDKLVRRPNSRELQDEVSRKIFKYGKLLVEIPNHLSIHAGGMIISEEPIYQYTATEFPPKGFPTTQFDMYVAEDVGLYKYDILSQRGLGHIKDAVELASRRSGEQIQIDQVDNFMSDPKINEELARGNTIGCFYIESPAMRQLLQKLQCKDYPTLVAASSIIRPGVAQSGMMRAYIERHRGQEVEYLHPRLKELMEETYGVMVYQEDVIKVAHHFAGIDLAEADIIRRAMSGKMRNKAGFAQVKDSFFKSCNEKGYPQEVSSEVWRQMEAFGGYSFSKAHSASFAVESYQSLFLKTYYPLEFITAVLNNFGGFYHTELYLNEARSMGAQIEAPCVNRSLNLASLQGEQIFLGFTLLKDLERDLVERLLDDRHHFGPFRGVEDFITRLNPSLEQVRLLIRCGAFRFTGDNKKRVLWQATLFLGKKSKKNLLQPGAQLFEASPKKFELPNLEHSELEDAYDELEILGFPLKNPFQFVRERLPQYLRCDQFDRYEARQVSTVGYLVCTKDVRAKGGKLMQFGTFMSPELLLFDTIHFPQSLQKYPITGRGIYRLDGKISLDFGVPTLEVQKLEILPWVADPRYADAPQGRGTDELLEKSKI